MEEKKKEVHEITDEEFEAEAEQFMKELEEEEE